MSDAQPAGATGPPSLTTPSPSIWKAFEDGKYVFFQVYQNINNGEAEWVTTDFFDTDADDKIIEHWDIIAPYASTTPLGHTFD